MYRKYRVNKGALKWRPEMEGWENEKNFFSQTAILPMLREDGAKEMYPAIFHRRLSYTDQSVWSLIWLTLNGLSGT